MKAILHASALCVLVGLGSCLGAGVLTGCATPPQNCSTSLVTAVSPATATADHMAVAPGDQQHFTATAAPAASPGCPVPEIIAVLTPQWTVSDTVNVKISSASDSTNGTATCLGTTNGPVTVTAIGSPSSGTQSGSHSETLGTATITCK